MDNKRASDQAPPDWDGKDGVEGEGAGAFACGIPWGLSYLDVAVKRGFVSKTDQEIQPIQIAAATTP